MLSIIVFTCPSITGMTFFNVTKLNYFYQEVYVSLYLDFLIFTSSYQRDGDNINNLLSILTIQNMKLKYEKNGRCRFFSDLCFTKLYIYPNFSQTYMIHMCQGHLSFGLSAALPFSYRSTFFIMMPSYPN